MLAQDHKNGWYFEIPSQKKLIHDEPEWRRPFALPGLLAFDAKPIASRWLDVESRKQAVSECIEGNYHTIAIALRSVEVSMSIDGRKVIDGWLTAGMAQISGPYQKVDAIFRGPCDMLHLHMPNDALNEISDEVGVGRFDQKASPDGSDFYKDPLILQLAKCILMADATGCSVGSACGNSLTLAIAMRILCCSTKPNSCTLSRVSALPHWKLRRVHEFIDANLSENVRLEDIANSVGSTPMHFAAQFRAATGERPHDFLLRRRVERAQKIMATSELSLVQVALSVGFQSQAHFATVFKKVTGATPGQWLKPNNSCHYVK
jgi:AraC family transcriptional regulator